MDKNKVKVANWPLGDYLYYFCDLQSTKKGRAPCSPHHWYSANTKQNWSQFPKSDIPTITRQFLVNCFQPSVGLRLRQNPTQFLEGPSAPHKQLQQWPLFLQGLCVQTFWIPKQQLQSSHSTDYPTTILISPKASTSSSQSAATSHTYAYFPNCYLFPGTALCLWLL